MNPINLLRQTAKLMSDAGYKTKEDWEKAGYVGLDELVAKAIKEAKAIYDAKAKLKMAKFKGLA